MLSLILGTAGTGKTYSIRKAIRECALSHRRSVLIVPEQFSFASEKALLDALGPELIRYSQVLSFRRLAENLFSEYPSFASRELDQSGKLIAMTLAVSQLGDTLSFYSSQSGSSAFAKELLSVSDELKNAHLTPDALRKLAQSAQSESLSAKLSELALITECYDATVEKSGLDPADSIFRATQILRENHGYFAGCDIFTDAFFGFTDSEMLMMGEFLRSADNVTVALPCPSLSEKENSVFYDVSACARRLTELARKNGIGVKTPVILTENVRTAQKDLVFLEKNAFVPGAPTCPEKPDAISLTLCGDIYAEAEYVCENIISLVREKGFRYRDITVITRNTALYTDPLFTAFERSGIPFFDDRRVPAVTKPLISLILSACENVCLGYDTEALLRLLKSGFFDFSEEEIGSIENYCFVWNIRGKEWREDFKGNPRGYEEFTDKDTEELEKINLIRRTLTLPLEKLKTDIRDADGEKFAKAVYSYLTGIGAKEGSLLLMKKAEALGEKELADSFPAVWDIAITMLEQFSAALGDAVLPHTKLYDLLCSVASKLDLADIPRRCDEIVFGDAERIRTENPRAVFVIGLNEGVFPPKQADSGIFTGSDRDFLSSCGYNLLPSAAKRAVSERFFLYEAITNASELLFLSCSSSTLKGEQLQPSFMVHTVKTLFPELEEKRFRPEPFRLICNDKTAFYLFCSIRRENSPLSASLLEYLGTTSYAEKVGTFLKSASPAGYRINDRSLAKALVGNKLVLSPSSLERFYKCRFGYFCRDQLKIKPLRRADISPVEIGSLLHFLLENVLKEYGADTLVSSDTAMLKKRVEELLYEYLENKMGGDFGKTARFSYTYGKLADTATDLLIRLGSEFAQSCFVPSDFELPIRDGADVSPIKFVSRDGTGVSLEGFIDRVDTFEHDGKKYVRVVDYKSGYKKFRLSDVYYGLSLQMLIYLFSVCENGTGKYSGTVPAGVLYMPAGAPSVVVTRSPSGDGGEKKSLDFYKMNGIVLSDDDVLEAMEPGQSGKFIPVERKKSGELKASSSVATLTQFALIRKYIGNLLSGIADTLAEGNIGAVPSKQGNELACRFCDYRAICRRPDDSEVRNFDNISDEEFFEKAERSDDLEKLD